MLLMVLHAQVHPNLDQPGCFGCKAASVSIAPSATPSRNGGGDSKRINDKEKEWAKDHRAYRNLVANGTQPRTLDGCAELEARASDKFEVEAGHVLKTKAERDQAREGIALAQQMIAEAE